MDLADCSAEKRTRNKKPGRERPPSREGYKLNIHLYEIDDLNPRAISRFDDLPVVLANDDLIHRIREGFKRLFHDDERWMLVIQSTACSLP